MIEITNLRKQYASGFVALDDITLKLKKAKFWRYWALMERVRRPSYQPFVALLTPLRAM